MSNKRKKTITPEELQRKFDNLLHQVKRIRITLTFNGTVKEQRRALRFLNSLSEDAQTYILASALTDFDYFDKLSSVFLERERRYKNEMLRTKKQEEDV